MNISDLDHLDVIVGTSSILGGEACVCINPLEPGDLNTSLTKIANISNTDISSYFDNGEGLAVLYQHGSSSEAGNKSYSLSTVLTPPGTSKSISLSSLVRVIA